MKKLIFLGSGNMAAAIGRGLCAMDAPFELGFFDIDIAKAEGLADEVSGRAFGDLTAAVAAADILLLAVKPQAMGDLLGDLAAQVKPEQLIITIAAGLPINYYREKLGAVPIVRVMPNTSTAVLSAISGLMADDLATAEHKQLAEQIFAAVGKTVWIGENDIHALTAISGSGPAYFYYFVECLAAAGERLGLPPDVAMSLARQTAIGSGKMLERRTEDAATLRVQVTSKGGTTAAALEVWQQGLAELAENACRACADRSAEMSAEFAK